MKKKQGKSKDGTFCDNCGEEVTDSDAHAKEHKKEWLKKNADKKKRIAVPSVVIRVWKDGDMVVRKVL